MEKVRIAFYKTQKKDLWGNIISFYTGLFNPGTPKYSHVEIGIFIDGEWKYYSSASKNTNGRTGTRWIEEAALLANKERWDIYEAIALRTKQEMITTCAEELFKEYDWFGIMGFATLFGQLNSKRKWYCSEICYYVFFGVWKKRTSPRRLYTKLKPHILGDKL